MKWTQREISGLIPVLWECLGGFFQDFCGEYVQSKGCLWAEITNQCRTPPQELADELCCHNGLTSTSVSSKPITDRALRTIFQSFLSFMELTRAQ